MSALWLLIPCYFANMAPVFGARLFGKKRVISKRLFGENKTWNGYALGVFAGVLGALLQGVLYSRFEFFRSISLIDYSSINLVYLGYYLGFAAMFGDLFKSFIKRRLKIKPGERFVPFDQIDFVVFAFVFISFIDFPSWNVILVGVLATFFLHIIVNHIGYFLKLRKNKW